MGRYRVKKNGIPILSHADINRIGGYLAESLRHTDDGGIPIIPSALPEVTDLGKLFRQRFGTFHLITDRYLSPAGTLLGLTAFRGGEMPVFDPSASGRRSMIRIPDDTIMIDRRLMAEPLAEIQRFTFAHEMGHALFHRLFCEDPENMKLYARQGEEPRQGILVDDGSCYQVITDNHIRNEHDWLEWQANAFAAAVLLPEEWVRLTADQLRKDFIRDGEDPDETEMIWLNELVTLLQDIFQVSAATAFYRLKGLGIAPDTYGFSDAGILVDRSAADGIS